MTDRALELRAMLDAAEQAASIQDFASAEEYLREAAVLQEAQGGPKHPDLANTLNNLGIVCERVGKPADAEACYRRAYAIATSTLSADDPLVLTSGQNLRDFCAATGKPFEPAPPSPPAPVAVSPVRSAPSPVRSAPPPPAPVPLRTPVVPPPPAAVDWADSLRSSAEVRSAIPIAPNEAATRSRHRRALWIVVGSGLLLILVIVLADQMWRSGDATTPTALPAPPSGEETTAPRRESPPPVVESAPETPAISEAPTTAIADAPEKPAATKPSDSRSVSPVSLVEAKLCRSLSTSTWQCTEATNPAAPGPFIFYTRVKSARDTTVQHRWFLNGDLQRTVDLRVGANPGAGYRTYSRNTIAAERRGTWTIELHDGSGALLHEERFVVP
jgi:hypothetical protein